jgi:hypothetical protein
LDLEAFGVTAALLVDVLGHARLKLVSAASELVASPCWPETANHTRPDSGSVFMIVFGKCFVSKCRLCPFFLHVWQALYACVFFVIRFILHLIRARSWRGSGKRLRSRGGKH